MKKQDFIPSIVKDNFMIRKLNNYFLLKNYREDKFFIIENTSFEIVNLIDNVRSLKEISILISNKYKKEYSIIYLDIEKYLVNLKKLKIVELKKK